MWKQIPELELSCLHFSTPVFYKSKCNERKDTMEDKLIFFLLLSSEWAVKIIDIYYIHASSTLNYSLLIAKEVLLF